MKKNILSILAICAALLGCQKNEISEPSFSGGDLHATIEDDASTKTVMDENNNIRWSEGDQIIAFMKSSYGHKYKLISSFVGKTYADFEPATSAGGNLSAGMELDHNVAYYPYSETIECQKSGSDYILNITLPYEQTYAAESFGNGSMAMVAVSENNNITFRNILGGMKLQLRGTQNVKSLKLEGNNNEKLSGAATVTAYTDETKPAITMASGASASVTLNCGSGIQLNESKATEFIIALPPVLFSKGFTVTITDTESKTYTVETDKANTVLRSSILNMPAFKLGETPDSETPDNAVDMILFDLDKLTVVPGTTYALTVNFEPFDASDKTLTWSSSAPSVAKVDQDGTVTSLSDGTAVISAVAVGGASASCTVKVVSCIAPTADYIDEYGVNHGKGIAVGKTVWAPVNCGYKASTSESKGFPYGKLYQWGRKYGQGYSERDAVKAEIISGPVMPSVGQAEENEDKFYKNSSAPWDWSMIQKDDLWNSGTEDSPIKTENDPCPIGWRVPTSSEFKFLVKNYTGKDFFGEYTICDSSPSIKLEYDGYRSNEAYTVLRDGGFWTSSINGKYSYYLQFKWYPRSVDDEGERANAFYVRCVQE